MKVGKDTSSSSSSEFDLSDFRKEEVQTISDVRLIAISEALNAFKENNSIALSNLKLKKLEFKDSRLARISRVIRPLMGLVGVGGMALDIWSICSDRTPRGQLSIWRNFTKFNKTEAFKDDIRSNPMISQVQVISLIFTGLVIATVGGFCCFEKNIANKVVAISTGVDVNCTMKEFKKSKRKIQAEDSRADLFLQVCQKINAFYEVINNVEVEGTNSLISTCDAAFEALQVNRIKFNYGQLALPTEIDPAESLVNDMTGSLEDAVNALIPKLEDEHVLLEIK